MLPFSANQFFAVFGAYNIAIWPAQIIAGGLGVLAVALVGCPGVAANRVIAGTLAAGWLWTGLAYHGIFFATINSLARIFAIGFAIEAVLIVFAGLCRAQLAFGWRRDISAIAGSFLVVYAAIFYPAIGYAMGHVYPNIPSFGLTPCPLTLFTYGLLLLTNDRVPKSVLIIPLLWSLIGGSAAFLLHMPQDWILLASGPTATALIWMRDVKEPQVRTVGVGA